MGTRQWCGGLTGLCHPNQTPQHGSVVIQSRSELQAAEESLGPCWYAPHGDKVRQKLQSLVFQHATLWWGGAGSGGDVGYGQTSIPVLPQTRGTGRGGRQGRDWQGGRSYRVRGRRHGLAKASVRQSAGRRLVYLQT